MLIRGTNLSLYKFKQGENDEYSVGQACDISQQYRKNFWTAI